MEDAAGNPKVYALVVAIQKASMDWCPRMFFAEGPATPPDTNHYTAMMEENPRGIMCSFYGVSRDKHSIVVNYY
jgi:hypothetical protein